MDVTLRCGHVVQIDEEDVPILIRRAWRAEEYRPGCFYVRALHYLPETKKQKTVYLHREMLGACSDELVDHKDGDGLNCRRSNLRIATRGQNMANTGPNRTNTSGVRGVSRDRETGKWVARIRVNGKTHWLGRFEQIKDAASAYERAARHHFGEFARVSER